MIWMWLQILVLCKTTAAKDKWNADVWTNVVHCMAGCFMDHSCYNVKIVVDKKTEVGVCQKESATLDVNLMKISRSELNETMKTFVMMTVHTRTHSEVSEKCPTLKIGSCCELPGYGRIHNNSSYLFALMDHHAGNRLWVYEPTKDIGSFHKTNIYVSDQDLDVIPVRRNCMFYIVSKHSVSVMAFNGQPRLWFMITSQILANAYDDLTKKFLYFSGENVIVSLFETEYPSKNHQLVHYMFYRKEDLIPNTFSLCPDGDRFILFKKKRKFIIGYTGSRGKQVRSGKMRMSSIFQPKKVSLKRMTAVQDMWPTAAVCVTRTVFLVHSYGRVELVNTRGRRLKQLTTCHSRALIGMGVLDEMFYIASKVNYSVILQLYSLTNGKLKVQMDLTGTTRKVISLM